jgi:hypothetical protein
MLNANVTRITAPVQFYFTVALWRTRKAESLLPEILWNRNLAVLFASLADGIVLKTETGIAKVYFTELPQEVQERFHWATPEAPREPFYGRWAAAAEDPAALAKLIAVGTVIIAGVALVISHIRSRRQPATLTSQRKVIRRPRR